MLWCITGHLKNFFCLLGLICQIPHVHLINLLRHYIRLLIVLCGGRSRLLIFWNSVLYFCFFIKMNNFVHYWFYFFDRLKSYSCFIWYDLRMSFLIEFKYRHLQTMCSTVSRQFFFHSASQ